MYISTFGIFLWGFFVGIAVCAVAIIVYGITITCKEEKNRKNRSVYHDDNSR